ncbi:efflux RND transporter periplasmic adaptor subunit [candidate division KSB1 bacterium]|nr:efflux RND transporter periplasmic adaptor subunit [candidate division KSB1 bacterium]
MESSKNSNTKKLVIGLIVVVVVAAFIIVNLKKGKGGQIEVQVTEVKKGTIMQTVSGTGKVQPETEVKISANVSAEIIGLHVEEGDSVVKNQLLVELDSQRYRALVDQAKSGLKSAQANLMKANSEYMRIADLFKQKLVSTAEKERAEADKLLAESQVEQATAGLNQAEDDLSKTRIYSPIAGTVTTLNKELGEIAVGSTFQADVIMTIADLSRMEVLAEVDENDVVLIALNDSTNIEIDAIPDTTFKGIVSEIAHTATTRGLGTQEEVTNFEVKIAVLEKVERLRPGMSSTVDILTETRHNVLSVPIQSVTVRSPDDLKTEAELKSKSKDNKDKSKQDKAETENGDKKSDTKNPEEKQLEVVFVVDGDQARIVPVETGISNDTDIEIKTGLEEGQKVVIGSYRAISKTLKNGSPVKISEKNENKKAIN